MKSRLLQRETLQGEIIMIEFELIHHSFFCTSYEMFWFSMVFEDWLDFLFYPTVLAAPEIAAAFAAFSCFIFSKCGHPPPPPL
mmetsp:Transcript_33744/g.81224  ORF Transcript_33744/g.81224 Transcript_33744/m.81224 type:complete len:83 (+) Transcript_33744:280-528(+)